MLLIERSDGHILNLSSATSFKQMNNDMLVEYTGDTYYLIKQFWKSELFIDVSETYYREFKGWPE